jgi:hypothetical protein
MLGLLAAFILLLAFATACSGGNDRNDRKATSEPRTPLHRPLHLPTVGAGAPCPVTAGGRPNPDVAIALGSGPAYPVLGFEGNHVPPDPKAVVPLRSEDLKGNAYWHKTLWTVDPEYDGPVLIRARGLDPPEALRFGIPGAEPGGTAELVRELEFRPEKSVSWRYGPSFTILPGPGCYAFQVDGTDFSEVIVFEAAVVTS